MGLIELNGLKVFAYHGVHEVEQLVGQWYTLDLKLVIDFSSAEENDELIGTLDYSQVSDLVTSEMKIKSKLIEHVAARIKKAIQKQYPTISSGAIRISKLNPPVKSALESVAVVTKF